MNELSPLQKEFLQALIRAYKLEDISILSDFLQGTHRILYYIYQNNEAENNPAALSDVLHVSRARITSVLHSLEKKGYLTTRTSVSDRRMVLVNLTKMGRLYMEEKQKKAEGYLAYLIERLGEENMREFTRLINLSVDIMEDKNSSGRKFRGF